MKCCDQYPYKQLIIYGEGEPRIGYERKVFICGDCGTLHVVGMTRYQPDVDINFQITSRHALDAVSIPVRDAEKRGKK